jgi:hypothetical protein
METKSSAVGWISITIMFIALAISALLIGSVLGITVILSIMPVFAILSLLSVVSICVISYGILTILGTLLSLGAYDTFMMSLKYNAMWPLTWGNRIVHGKMLGEN